MKGGVADGDEILAAVALVDLMLRELVLVRRRDLVTGSLGETSGVGKEADDAMGEAIVLTRLALRIVGPGPSSSLFSTMEATDSVSVTPGAELYALRGLLIAVAHALIFAPAADLEVRLRSARATGRLLSSRTSGNDFTGSCVLATEALRKFLGLCGRTTSVSSLLSR